MADRKISDLTALTAPAAGDYLPIVDISEVSAANKNKRITIEELLRGAPDGTAAAPSIGFESDPNTGIYRPGADQLAISTNGSQRVIVDSSGNVGVGTGSPSALGKALDLYGGTSQGASIALEANNGAEFCTIFSGPTASDPTSIYSKSGFKFATATAKDATGFSEKMRLDTSGRLLVGTSSALTGATAQYSKNVNLGNSANAAGNAVVAIGRGTAATSISSGNQIGSIYFTDNGAGEFASIDCFADAAPGTNDYPGRLVFSTTADGASSPTERMRIGNDGRTSAFSASSTNTLTLSSAAAAGTTFKFIEGAYGATGVNTGTESFRVYTNGDVQNTNNSYGSISDIKLKENIVDANSQWDDIKALQVRNYNFKEGQTHTQIGLVAQEVELVSPGLVSESPDRDAEGNDLGTVTKSVNYSVLYMKAVKALQEAMERIEVLEQRLTDAGIA